MSIYTVTKGGESIESEVLDGKTNSLSYFVNLDTRVVGYYIGKQISGKELKPGTKTWLDVLETARLLWQKAVEGI